MKILTEKDLPLEKKTAVAIGLFDGVHIGHLKLIADICAKKDLIPTIYTFDHKMRATQPILTLSEKFSVFASLGITQCYVHSFTEEFAKQTPSEFLKKLTDDFNVAHITVGFDFRFGRGAEGDVKTLEEYKDEFNYSLTVVPQITVDSIKVSSTRVRDYIINGNLEAAAALMSRFYFIENKVIPGRHLGGKLGIPTANIAVDKLLPPYGVYASIVQTEFGRFPGVTNIGVKPTVQNTQTPNAETYIIHFNEEIYGENIRVYLVKMLRPEMKFDSIEDLRKRMSFDAGCAAEMLADLDVYKKNLI